MQKVSQIMKRTVFLTVSLLSAMLPTTAFAQDLADVYHLALKNDAQLQAAASQRKSELENKPEARALLLPSISGQASYTRYHNHVISRGPASTSAFFPNNSTYNEPSASVSLTQPIFNWNAWSQLEQADMQVAYAEAQFRAAKQNLLIRVSNAYFNLLQANDNLQYALTDKKAIAQQLNQAQQRYNVGTAANTDLQNARASYDQAKSLVIQAKAKVRSARQALQVITNVPPTNIQPLRQQIPLNPPSPASPQAWVHIAMDSNLSIKQAQIQAKINKKQIQIAESGHYPTLNLVAGYSYFDTTGKNFGTQETDSDVGVQLNIPIFSGGAVSSRAHQARYTYEQSAHTLDQTRRQVRASTLDDYDNVESGISNVESLKQGVKSARISLKATKESYKVGTRTEIDVLNALQALYQAKQNYSQARYTYIENLLQLKQDAGSLGPSDIMAVDQLIADKSSQAGKPAAEKGKMKSGNGDKS